MNYDKHGDTLSLSPCATEPRPEATLSEIVRNNSSDLDNLDYVINLLYTHLYGCTEPRNESTEEAPTCMMEEVTNQSRKLRIINEKLAKICSKLGV
jgi:hypothetical protein